MAYIHPRHWGIPGAATLISCSWRSSCKIKGMHIAQITCYQFRLPFQDPIWFAGRRVSERHGLLLAVAGEDGRVGWGEASPLPGYSRESLTDAMAVARLHATQLCASTVDAAQQQLTPNTVGLPSVYFAYERALHAVAPENAQRRRTLPLCALLSGDADAVCAQALQARHAGYATVKLKVGVRPLAEDIVLVGELRRRLGAACRMRFDANQAWTLEEALRFCDAVGDANVEYLEEPLADPAQLPELHARTGLPCAVDECLQALSACLFMGDHNTPRPDVAALRAVIDAAQVLVWKPTVCMPPDCMGLSGNAPVVLSAAYESGVGTAGILQYAAGREEDAPAPGIDTYSRLTHDVLPIRLPVETSVADMEAIAHALQAPDAARLNEAWHVS